jgi:hypothetical protein
MVNAYLRCIDEPETRASVEGTDGMTGCGSSNTQRDVLVH